jgi:hypothetical protein
MMALPDPATMDPEIESNRFNWLLYGAENDLFEIHGGCGFSKKLLHTMSQVTYCAARLQQEPTSTIVPITARFLMRTLTDMRQWSREGKSWEECQKRAQTIEWVRVIPDDVIVSSKEDMTDVTAEAWRIAAIIYYQCRLLRYEFGREQEMAEQGIWLEKNCVKPLSLSFHAYLLLLLLLDKEQKQNGKYANMASTFADYHETTRKFFPI